MTDAKAAPAPTPVVVVKPSPTAVPWSDKIAKVRITPGKGAESAMFRGKVFTKDSEPIAPGDVSELAEASADGSLVIEKFNKDGVEVNSQGKPLKTIEHGRPAQVTAKQLAAAQAKKAEKE